MTSQSPRIYVYKITFEEVPYYYYGVHKEKKFNENYLGSPTTNKWCWDFYTPKKQILEVFDYTDRGYIKAQEIEKRLIKPVLNDQLCLNENVGGIFSLKISSQNGRKTGKRLFEEKRGCFALSEEERRNLSREIGLKNKENGVAIFAIPKEQRIETSRRAGLTTKERNVGIFNIPTEEHIKNCVNGGLKAKELGVGIHGLTEEERIKNSRKAGIKTKDLKIGIHGLTEEQKKEACKKGGLKNKENRTGVCGLTKEQRQRSVKKTNSQKWMCTETGFITNSGSLSRYQQARGIDTTKRIRLE